MMNPYNKSVFHSCNRLWLLVCSAVDLTNQWHILPCILSNVLAESESGEEPFPESGTRPLRHWICRPNSRFVLLQKMVFSCTVSNICQSDIRVISVKHNNEYDFSSINQIFYFFTLLYFTLLCFILVKKKWWQHLLATQMIHSIILFVSDMHLCLGNISTHFRQSLAW